MKQALSDEERLMRQQRALLYPDHPFGAHAPQPNVSIRSLELVPRHLQTGQGCMLNITLSNTGDLASHELLFVTLSNRASKIYPEVNTAETRTNALIRPRRTLTLSVELSPELIRKIVPSDSEENETHLVDICVSGAHQLQGSPRITAFSILTAEYPANKQTDRLIRSLMGQTA